MKISTRVSGIASLLTRSNPKGLRQSKYRRPINTNFVEPFPPLPLSARATKQLTCQKSFFRYSPFHSSKPHGLFLLSLGTCNRTTLHLPPTQYSHNQAVIRFLAGPALPCLYCLRLRRPRRKQRCRFLLSGVGWMDSGDWIWRAITITDHHYSQGPFSWVEKKEEYKSTIVNPKHS